MDKYINSGLLTVPNIIAIGAIVFFWGCCVFTIRQNAVGS